MKICTKCKTEKHTESFYKHKAYKNGICSACKDCYNQAGREWKKANAEKKRIDDAKWRAANPEKVKEYRKRVAMKHVVTTKSHLNTVMRSNIRQALNGAKAGRKWESLVSFTADQLKKHLEKLFKPGMTWENYGTHWHIDHKIPIAAFNYSQPEHIDFKLCWSLVNLQPLEAKENLSKRDKLNKPFQPALEIQEVA